MDTVRLGADATRLRAELMSALTEVGDSRTRIVEASLTERRRVERDLHDGAQQQFLAVAATLAQADLVDDSGVRSVVDQARNTLSRALQELRALARGIHPAALSQGGLEAALPALVERAPFPVTFTVHNATRTSSATTQTAAYFVIAELLTNAARHAGATHASVDVSANHDRLTVRVSDNGHGGARFVTGGGLSGLRDRVNALGGTLDLDDSGGTTGRAVLPQRTQETNP